MAQKIDMAHIADNDRLQSAASSGSSCAWSTGLAKMGTWRNLRLRGEIAKMSSSTRYVSGLEQALLPIARLLTEIEANGSRTE